MSESRVRENRMHGSMRRREATNASRASTRRAAAEASRRPYDAAVGAGWTEQAPVALADRMDSDGGDS
jgi:hypothetical protein